MAEVETSAAVVPVPRPNAQEFRKKTKDLEGEISASQEKLNNLRTESQRLINTRREAFEKLEAARKELQQAKDERNRLTGQFKTVPESQSALKLTPKAIEAIREKKKGLKFQDLRSLDARIEEITYLQSQGQLSIREERSLVAELDKLKVNRVELAAIEDVEKQINASRAEAAERRKVLNSLREELGDSLTALEKKINAAQEKCTSLNNRRQELQKNIENIFEKMNSIRDSIKAKEGELSTVRSEYNEAKKAYDADQQRIAREKVEKAGAEVPVLEEAAVIKEDEFVAPFSVEIDTCKKLLAFFESVVSTEETKTEEAPVAKSNKKDDDDEFAALRGNKAKKGKKKSTNANPNIHVDLGIINFCAVLGVDAPTRQSEVPAAIEQVKSKLAVYEKLASEQQNATVSA